MGDGYTDYHRQFHKNAHATGKTCTECGQNPDGTYIWSKMSTEQKLDNLNERLSAIEELKLAVAKEWDSDKYCDELNK